MAKKQPKPDPACQSWIEEQPAEHQTWLAALRQQIVATVPETEESFKWSRPCYAIGGTLFCYLAAAKNYVTIGFHRGAELPDPDGMLEGTGKGMRHLKVRSESDASSKVVRELIHDAAALENSTS